MQASIILTLLASIHLATSLPLNRREIVARDVSNAWDMPALKVATLVVRKDNDAKDNTHDLAASSGLLNLISRDEDHDANSVDDSAASAGLINLTT